MRTKWLKRCTVYIEYRMDAGNSDPTWKALRARVRQEISPGTYHYGTDLFIPTCKSIDMAISQSLMVTQGYCEEVEFIFDRRIGKSPMVFRDGRLIAHHQEMVV